MTLRRKARAHSLCLSAVRAHAGQLRGAERRSGVGSRRDIVFYASHVHGSTDAVERQLRPQATQKRAYESIRRAEDDAIKERHNGQISYRHRCRRGLRHIACEQAAPPPPPSHPRTFLHSTRENAKYFQKKNKRAGCQAVIVTDQEFLFGHRT